LKNSCLFEFYKSQIAKPLITLLFNYAQASFNCLSEAHYLGKRRSGVSKGKGNSWKSEAILGRDENLDEKILVGKLATLDGVCGE
jgi:hypothetical protein